MLLNSKGEMVTNILYHLKLFRKFINLTIFSYAAQLLVLLTSNS